MFIYYLVCLFAIYAFVLESKQFSKRNKYMQNNLHMFLNMQIKYMNIYPLLTGVNIRFKRIK